MIGYILKLINILDNAVNTHSSINIISDWTIFILSGLSILKLFIYLEKIKLPEPVWAFFWVIKTNINGILASIRTWKNCKISENNNICRYKFNCDNSSLYLYIGKNGSYIVCSNHLEKFKIDKGELDKNNISFWTLYKIGLYLKNRKNYNP